MIDKSKPKPPKTVADIQRSLSAESMRKYGLWEQFITDTVNDNGLIELRWEHDYFIFVKLVISATSELAVGDLNDTVVYDLKEMVEVSVSGIRGAKTPPIKDLTIDKIKPMLIDRFEAWSNLYAKLPSINKWGMQDTQKSHKNCISIKN